jgi:NAD(P)-dependent dehydrogenase (short-subunit alcohol dehydrogenase family)
MTTTAARSPIQSFLNSLHAKYAPYREGEVATYIPELAKADPEAFGICIATIDGYAYEVGDSRREFTIQSISKPFVYGLALDDHGAYGASKGGLNMLTRVMTVEWAKHNVQSNSICPTVILTPMGEMVWGDPAKGDPMKAKIPAGRFGRTTEVADLILFLASSASDMICGQVILLDGGFTAQ